MEILLQITGALIAILLGVVAAQLREINVRSKRTHDMANKTQAELYLYLERQDTHGKTLDDHEERLREQERRR